MDDTISLPRSRNRVLTRSLVLEMALIVAGAFIAYSAIGAWLWRGGFVSTPLLFLAEKMAIANGGAPSRIIGAAFVYPPLALALMAPFHNPIVGQAALGAIVDGLFIFWTRRHIQSPLTRRLTQLSFLGSGVILYTSIEDAGALLACELAALATFALLRFFEKNYSPDLFAAGTFVGLTFFIDFRVIALAIVFVPTLIWTAGHTSRDKFVAVLIALVVPSFLMALGWAYVNWIFLGDPIAFAHGPTSFFHIRALPGHGSLTPQALLALGLMLSPVWVAPRALLHLDRRTQLAAIFMLAASLLWAIGFSTQTATGAITIWLIPLGVAIAFSATRRASLLLNTALVVSVLGSWLFISTGSADAGSFYRSLTSLTPVTNTTRAWTISAATAGARHVLMDDADLYGVVALDEKTDRFILPYSRTFAKALENPQLFADAIVVSTAADDRILQRYPSLAAGALPGYHVTRNVDGARIFTRMTPVPESGPPLALTIPQVWHIAYLVLCALSALGIVAGMRHTSLKLTGNGAL
jgi:hypothetical protein